MNSLKTTILLAALTGLLLAVGSFFGGTKGMTVMFVVSILMNFFSYWYSDKIVLSMYGAREVTHQEAPDLIRMVSALAQKAKIPMPKVYIIDTDVPNAFATGRDPEHGAVAVTTGIMRALNYEELEGVIAHELAHIKNRDTLISTVVATIAGVITMIANIAQWTAFLGFGRSNDEEGNGIAGIVEFIFLVVLAPLAATLIQLGISRSREYQADETGALVSGNPLALASALQKIEYYAQHRIMPEATPATSHLFIVNPFSGGDWLVSLFSTHPTTAQRVARLQELAKRIR
ncbi:zinc metalloprotease HtpX [Sporolituus thermophilus]|uniref:Protease HtpX homolog n=1 Tax=Sporolituus thermophilus DSM 23256 TaxID=1123285 RepID=A0A1G7JMW7_9FIRM|nr:zinc metalloprotease HtpX [Sporolituus thermophilus]SDF26298.1 Heat shock protein. Metallo peptidase. MEROPS family M48B [Sporolituus thermophilus DSM 23256]